MNIQKILRSFSLICLVILPNLSNGMSLFKKPPTLTQRAVGKVIHSISHAHPLVNSAVCLGIGAGATGFSTLDSYRIYKMNPIIATLGLGCATGLLALSLRFTPKAMSYASRGLKDLNSEYNRALKKGRLFGPVAKPTVPLIKSVITGIAKGLTVGIATAPAALAGLLGSYSAIGGWRTFRQDDYLD